MKHPETKEQGSLVALKFQCLKELLKDVSHAKDAKRELDLLVELQELGSPFIMKINAAFITDHFLVIVMPLLLGGDLRHHLSEYGRFELMRTKLLTAEICCGLEAIHKLGVVYRDLKPENVVLTECGHARICDFDRSRHMSEDASEEMIEYTGTPGYMAPELINLERYDQGIDIWSLGCLVFELLHTHLPWKGEVCYESHVDAKNFPPPNYHQRFRTNPEVKSLVSSMLQYSMRERIGCKDEAGKVDWEEIKKHHFFKTIEWKKVLAEETAPPSMPTLNERVTEVREHCWGKCKSDWNPKLKTLTEKERKLVKEIFSDYFYSSHSSSSAHKDRKGTQK
mmetsp:Transcript_7270/g.10149  ORF Transcript_7270/g.10149 Transcript_7270/m.10149 type:complete len:338 (-) Transcript_7270:214-1227(-)|eukprot:CAMPEP_0184478418 /NCGR_PEP_ID=MMETSP0113_2-20130426/453_1 /TAXON_ID=91329 /ORGANISM="Norrisiella sphaerica, Strain BC52" /LENGTH=337 /DNA_ID=CAMNT_0026856201 /DNA_START=308 /DNA_END=1321 /DNA_ORIENTATION=-